jgi:hypothetical protein
MYLKSLESTALNFYNSYGHEKLLTLQALFFFERGGPKALEAFIHHCGYKLQLDP